MPSKAPSKAALAALAFSLTASASFAQEAPVIGAPLGAPLGETAPVAAPAPQRVLRSVDPWQVGQAGRDERLMPDSLWRNSDAAAIGPLMDRITGPSVSPTATRLARAALLTGGAPPAGSEAAANEALRKRYAALGRLGAADEISAMANVSSGALSDENILGFAAQADLARGKPSDACRRASNAPSAVSPFLMRLRAFCYASNGEVAASDMAVEVARGAGVSDAWLFSALPAVAGEPTTALAKFDTSLNATVSVEGELRRGAKPLANASPLALGAVARGANAPEALRAEAAQSALRMYALEPRLAREAALAAGKLKGAPLLATSLQAIGAAQEPGAKAQAIDAFFKKTATYADFVGAARVLSDDIKALPRDASTANYALAMARARLSVGDEAGAAQWRDTITLATASPGEMNRAALDVALVAGGHGGESLGRAMFERRVELGGANAARDALVLGALGMAMPASATALIGAMPQPKTLKVADAATVAAMTSAAQRGAIGETTLLASLVIAPGAHMIDRNSLVSVIQALRAVGLQDRAREVAVEAIIGGGIG